MLKLYFIGDLDTKTETGEEWLLQVRLALCKVR